MHCVYVFVCFDALRPKPTAKVMAGRSKISRFYLVSVAEQAGLSLCMLGNFACFLFCAHIFQN